MGAPFGVRFFFTLNKSYLGIWRRARARAPSKSQKIQENFLSEKIIGCCIAVHKFVGPGLPESVYEEALVYELCAENLECSRQKNMPVNYKGFSLNFGFRADIIVEDKVLIEPKSVDKLQPIHHKQVLTYLKVSNLKLGLLINFNAVLIKDGIKRLVNGL